MRLNLQLKGVFRTKLSHDIVYLVFGSGFSQALILLSNLFIARLIGIVDFGKLGIIQSTLSLFAILSGTTFGLTPQKYIAEFLNVDKMKVERVLSLSNCFIFVFSILISLLLFVFADLISVRFLHDAKLANSLRISTSILFFNSIFGAQSGILAGFKKFKHLSIINLLRGIISLPTMLLGGYLYKLDGILWGTALAAFISFLLTQREIYLTKKKYHIKSTTFTEFIKEKNVIISYSLPAVVSAIVSMPIIWYSNILLVGSKNGYHQMGLFNMANSWRLLILFIPSILNQPFLSYLSSANGERRNDLFSKYLKINFLAVLVATVVPVVLISIASPFISKQYGNEFSQAPALICLLSVSCIFSGMASVFGNVFYTLEKVWLGAFLNFLWGASLLVSFNLFEKHDAISLGCAYLISYIIHVINSFISYKVITSQKMIANDNNN